MPAALPYALAAVSIAQGIQGYQQNKAMAKATSRQADAAIQQEQTTLGLKQDQLKRQQQIAAGKATVAAAGSGATLGSFDYLFEDNANQSLMDRYMLDYDSKVTQENIRYNAAVEKQQYKSAARSSLIGGVVKAGSGFLTSDVGKTASTNAYNSFGQTIGRQFSSSPVGPYQPYFSSLV